MRMLIAKVLVAATLASGAALVSANTATAAEPCTQPPGGSKCVVNGAGVDTSKEIATTKAELNAGQKCVSGKIRLKHAEIIELKGTQTGDWYVFVTARCW
ncbi:hypothetical protein BCF44_1394 [Kutzneria buriramensis]|uniref:Secreted protein n=1 Tax=Kutzneria buriramensis TaxID=1045776 RepID=A0A3E0G5M1_9PSEU|nr:hypothetical protein BCF44_1394 [Kutzneria buriramensis]